jgi:hypothetical protein
VRYFTATLGALLVFICCAVGCFILAAFRPFQFTLTLTIGIGTFTIRNPIALAGLPIGVLAAIHSFRSTMKRYAKADENLGAIQSDTEH